MKPAKTLTKVLYTPWMVQADESSCPGGSLILARLMVDQLHFVVCLSTYVIEIQHIDVFAGQLQCPDEALNHVVRGDWADTSIGKTRLVQC